MIDRRDFVIGSLAAAAGLACGTRAGGPGPSSSSSPSPSPSQPTVAAPPRKRKILVLGGTKFLGPHVVTAALARGHTVTLFNRGKTNPGLFPEVEKLHGDRDGHLEALAGRKWDAVVDPSGFVPRIVRASAELLAPNVGRYVFVSTVSVYRDFTAADPDESAPLMAIDDPTNEDVGKNYGALKALCERAAETAMPGRVANVRPGLIVGPLDPTGRFTHWPSRLRDGGDVLAPGDGTTPAQWIDARDLAAWIVRVVEQETVGTFNAAGPARLTTFKQALDGVHAAAGGKANLVWVDEPFLEAQHVAAWSEMPMWTGSDRFFGTMSNARAVAAGLAFRDIAETAKDTLAWLDSLPEDERAKVASSGIKRDKEARVLAAWREKR